MRRYLLLPVIREKKNRNIQVSEVNLAVEIQVSAACGWMWAVFLGQSADIFHYYSSYPREVENWARVFKEKALIQARIKVLNT